MKFCTNIHDSQKMNPADFEDPMTSCSATMRLTFLAHTVVKCLNSYWWFAMKSDINGARRMNNDFGLF